MTGDDRDWTIALNISVPPSPAWVLELAEAIAEAVRILNHQTLHPEALPRPADADEAIRALALAASRLPQLFGQIGERLDSGRRGPTVISARRALAEAGVHAERLETALKTAAREARHMHTAPGTGEEGS